jgi:hypothetical protein
MPLTSLMSRESNPSRWPSCTSGARSSRSSSPSTGKVEQLKESGAPLGRDVRHYADLYVLASRLEVTAMLASDEYDEIKVDYDEKESRLLPAQLPPSAEPPLHDQRRTLPIRRTPSGHRARIRRGVPPPLLPTSSKPR